MNYQNLLIYLWAVTMALAISMQGYWMLFT
jgi:hypothetical protein